MVSDPGFIDLDDLTHFALFATAFVLLFAGPIVAAYRRALTNSILGGQP